MAEQKLIDVRGIGPATAKRLYDAGVSTVSEVASSAAEKLAAISGFPISRAQSILGAAREALGSAPAPESTPAPAEEPKKAKKAKKKSKKSKKPEKSKKGKKKAKKAKKGKKGKKKGKKK